MALGQAQGAYLRNLLDWTQLCGHEGLHEIINSVMFQEIAKINAEAVRELQPKISIWTNGGGDEGDGSSNGAMKEVAGVYKMLPPLFMTAHEQTGMLPPTWMGTFPKSGSNNLILN
ncbi:hypothetical protein CerSpe_052170 [Prunus speciosa]